MAEPTSTDSDEAPRDEVEQALLRRALGFRQEEVHTEDLCDKKTGEVLESFRRRTVREAHAGGLSERESPFARHYARDWRDEVRTFTRPTDVFRKPPETVAQKILHALESRHPRTRYRIGLGAHIMPFLHAIMPARWWDALVRRFLKIKI